MNFVNSDSVSKILGDIKKQDFDKDAFKEKMKQKKEELYLLLENDLGYVNGNDERFKELLSVAVRFPHETVKNVVLLHAQKKEAICYKTAFEWKKIGVHKTRSAKPFWLLVKGGTWVNNGKTGNYWNPTELIDVVDTNATVRQSGIEKVQPEMIWPALIKLAQREDIGLNVTQDSNILPEGCDSLYLPGSDTILLRRGLSPHQSCENLIFELCHRTLCQEDRGYDRTLTSNFEAYAAAYCVMSGLGLTVEEFQFAPELFTAQNSKEMEEQLRCALRAGHSVSQQLERCSLEERHSLAQGGAERVPEPMRGGEL